jgi:hypothetical protein
MEVFFIGLALLAAIWLVVVLGSSLFGSSV